jgi:hypothetical protein
VAAVSAAALAAVVDAAAVVVVAAYVDEVRAVACKAAAECAVVAAAAPVVAVEAVEAVADRFHQQPAVLHENTPPTPWIRDARRHVARGHDCQRCAAVLADGA